MDHLEGWIDEVDFPAHKQDLIDAAAESDAPQDLVERLQALSREQYESRAEVEEEFAEQD